MKEIENYINQFPENIQIILQKIRTIIKIHAPEAEEMIAYGMPAYKSNKKPLVYFAAYNNHIGFYSIPSENSSFKKDLSAYHQGKGSVQFPLTEPIPFDLIERIVIFKVNEIKQKTRK